MFNLVEIAFDGESLPAPCKYGNIIGSHSCYCHHTSPDAPRKCPIWRNGGEWTAANCALFEGIALSKPIDQTPHQS